MTALLKQCNKCGKTKPVSAFYKNKKSKDGVYLWCRPCAAACKKASRARRNPEQVARDRARVEAWRVANPDRVKEIDRGVYLRKLGVTLEGYDKMFEEQNRRCAICNKEPSKTRLAVDHCHETGRVRGLLCVNCNTALGKLQDDPALLQKARDYIS